jgi:sugar O-acyltransferase (sialic acid O-acetyltransferase NeuD family)
MKPLVIFGAGDIASVAHFYFTHDTERKVVAFTVDQEYLKETTYCGLPVVPFETITSQYPPDQYELFVAVSYAKMNQVRAQKCEEAKAKGYHLASYISSKATVWPGTPFGDNCFILEDNTIQPFTKIGNHVTLWSGNHIGHHSTISDNCFITSHVVVSGGVVVGENCFIGVNATLRDHITLGKHCIIGAASLILKDTEDYGVYIGNPAELSPVPSNRIKKL